MRSRQEEMGELAESELGGGGLGGAAAASEVGADAQATHYLLLTTDSSTTHYSLLTTHRRGWHQRPGRPRRARR